MPLKIIRFLLITSCLLGGHSKFLSPALAQHPYIQQVAFPYQLPAKTIYDLFSDSKKQLWLGTDKGLFSFNGKEAKRIPFQKTFQADITHLREDQEGRIWGMNFTKQLFYVEQDTLRLFPIQAEDFVGSIVNFDFAEGLLWVGHIH